MDRLRGLTGFVQRFSGGSDGGGVGDNAVFTGDAERRR